jgi:hypothetical protein
MARAVRLSRCRVTRRAGIAKTVTPHTLRHAFITASFDAWAGASPVRLPSYGGIPSSVGGRCQGTRMILPRAVRPEDSASSMAVATSASG